MKETRYTLGLDLLTALVAGTECRIMISLNETMVFKRDYCSSEDLLRAVSIGLGRSFTEEPFEKDPSNKPPESIL